MGDTVGAESHKHHRKQEERQQAVRNVAQRRVLAQLLARQEHKRQQQQAVDRAPDDECPVSTVPQARQREHNHHVQRCAPLAAARAAQREIDIVTEPRHQRDVPPLPQFLHVAREERVVEVGTQPDVQQACRAEKEIIINTLLTI